MLVIKVVVLAVAVVGCNKKEGSTSKTVNGDVTTTTVTDKNGRSLTMEVDNSDPSTCASSAACVKLAESLDTKDKRYVEAMKRACDFGDAEACGHAGIAYHGGEGVAKDFAVARTFAQKGCDKKDASACSLLSLIYLNGEGVDVDHARALELAMRSCDAAAETETDTDVAAACGNAGILLADVKPLDATKVRHYFERGCALAADQCTNFGVATAQGLFGPSDPVAARAIFKKACDADIADACSALGLQLIRSEGGPKDATLAKSLFDKACAAGSKKGCINQKKYP